MKIINLHEKQKRNNKIKIILKNSLLALIISGVALSTVPTVEYSIAYNKYKKKSSFQFENESRKEYVIRMFREALNANSKISGPNKKIISDAFVDLVLENIGEYFTDEMVIKMMAVASTENLSKLTELENEKAWYLAYYNEYLNNIALYDTPDKTAEEIIAHEQLHAILRGSFSKKAYALNEGGTAYSVKGDTAYGTFKSYFNILTFVIGKEKLMNHFLNGNLEGLKADLYKYADKDKTDRFINTLDRQLFTSYMHVFLFNMGIDFDDLDWLYEANDYYREENEEFITSILEAKFGKKVEDMPLAKVLLGYYAPEIIGLTLMRNDYGEYAPYCKAEYYSEVQIKVTIEFVTNRIIQGEDPNRIVEEYLFTYEEFANMDIDTLIEDAKNKHIDELNQKIADKTLFMFPQS